MERSSVELVVDEFADLVDIWDEFLKIYFYFRSIWTHIMESFQRNLLRSFSLMFYYEALCQNKTV